MNINHNKKICFCTCAVKGAFRVGQVMVGGNLSENNYQFAGTVIAKPHRWGGFRNKKVVAPVQEAASPRSSVSRVGFFCGP